jgi:hypothetical protein
MEKNDDNTQIYARIEIPCKEVSYTFDKNGYREEFLKGILSKTEFETIVQESSKIMGKSVQKKKENDEVKIPKFFIILSIIAICFSILYLITLSVASKSQNAVALVAFGIFCLTIAAILILILSIFNFCRKIREFKTINVFIKEDLDEYFSQINSKFSGCFEFRFLPTKNLVELVTFKKSDIMINEEISERKKLIEEEDNKSELEEDEKKSQNVSQVSQNNSRIELSSRVSSNRTENKKLLKKNFGKSKVV